MSGVLWFGGLRPNRSRGRFLLSKGVDLAETGDRTRNEFHPGGSPLDPELKERFVNPSLMSRLETAPTDDGCELFRMAFYSFPTPDVISPPLCVAAISGETTIVRNLIWVSCMMS